MFVFGCDKLKGTESDPIITYAGNSTDLTIDWNPTQFSAYDDICTWYINCLDGVKAYAVHLYSD